MPELPEVETVRKGLIQGMLNKTFEDVLVRREGLRYPFPDDLATLCLLYTSPSPRDGW